MNACVRSGMLYLRMRSAHLKLPNAPNIQQALLGDQRFVTYFPVLGGLGKIYLGPQQVVTSVTMIDPATPGHLAALSEAVKTFPSDAYEASRFPVASAVHAYKLFFGGLETCMAQGTSVTVALVGDALAIPVSALLREEPLHTRNGANLRQAKWLIRDNDFTIVQSVQHFFATHPASGQEPLQTSRAYLGIGDPKFDQKQTSKLLSSAQLRGRFPTPSGSLELAELPETADEIRAASALFGETNSLLLGGNGTKSSFRSMPLSDYAILHFATHGLVKEDVAEFNRCSSCPYTGLG